MDSIAITENQTRVKSQGPNRIGHHPIQGVIFEGWLIRRCMCGFVLLLSPQSGTLWWLLARSNPRPIASIHELYAALATECRYYRRPEDRKPRQDDQLLAVHVRVKDQLAAATARIKVLEDLVADLRRQLATKVVAASPTATVPGRFGPTVVVKRRN